MTIEAMALFASRLYTAQYITAAFFSLQPLSIERLKTTPHHPYPTQEPVAVPDSSSGAGTSSSSSALVTTGESDSPQSIEVRGGAGACTCWNE